MGKKHLTIIVSAMLAAVPGQGGWAWAVLQYLLGLRQLGHKVHFVEPLASESLIPAGVSIQQSKNADYFRHVLQDFDLTNSSTLLLKGTRQAAGIPFEKLLQVVGRTDLFVNISGRLTDLDLVDSIPVRVYLDLDPAFTQLWHEADGIDMHFDGHTHYVSIGHAIGQADCDIPSCGLNWITTNQPIVLKYWPIAGTTKYDGFTTVANWRGYGSAHYNGEFYGQKAHSWRQVIELPGLTDEKFILALGIHPDETNDLQMLARNGWRLIDPLKVVSTPVDYHNFVQTSKAEFGIAKSGYVKSRCGWFSDRSVCYLASGRPVLAQETGFSRFLPSGDGLIAFETVDDALAGIDAINSDYAAHARAARAVAEDHFDSDKVLTRLLQEIGLTS